MPARMRQRKPLRKPAQLEQQVICRHPDRIARQVCACRPDAEELRGDGLFSRLIQDGLQPALERYAKSKIFRREWVMTKIAEVMTDRPRAITPETSIREAARLMDEEDVGSLPVVEDGARLVGIVTDRDIAIRAVGRALEPEQTSVMDIASTEVYALTPDDDLDDALEMMARAQVRRLPIVVRENELVGMVAQADIARTSKEKSTGEVVEAISRAPRGPRVAGADDSGEQGSPRSEADRQRGVGSERGEAASGYEQGHRDRPPDE